MRFEYHVDVFLSKVGSSTVAEGLPEGVGVLGLTEGVGVLGLPVGVLVFAGVGFFGVGAFLTTTLRKGQN